MRSKTPQFTVDKAEIERLEKAQAKIRANASPAQLQMLRDADTAFETVSQEFDERNRQENVLRHWAKGLCGFDLDMNEIEKLRDTLQSAPNGTTVHMRVKRGDVSVFKTSFGTVDRVDRYLLTLEKTVIDTMNNSQFTSLRFRGLMELAFKRLKEDLNTWFKKTANRSKR